MATGRAIPFRLTLVLLAGGVGVAASQQIGAAQNSTSPQNNSAISGQVPVLQNTAGQLPVQPVALTPSQMPPSPPRITYAGDRLTVVANNAMLDDVLAGIGKAIGANVQGMQPQGTERVFGQFGPAAPSQVINTLLTGSQYDFVLVGSLGNFGSVREIILSRKQTGADQSGQPSQYVPVQQTTAPAYRTNESVPLVNDSTPLVDNQQQQPELTPEERAGFRRNRRGPGAREIVRPQGQQPVPQPPPSSNNPN